MKQTLSGLRKENEELRGIIEDVMWMSRRYADMRRTFAPNTFNNALMRLQALGLGHLCQADESGTHPQMWARDGQLGEWDPVTKRFVPPATQGTNT